MKSIIIPQNYKSIIHKIYITAIENKFNVYIAGGFVRDLLINREPKDLDIMVCGGKSEADRRLAGINFSKILANKYTLSSPILFEKFGTSKLFLDNKEIEFVMPRKEYYDANSRNPYTQIAPLKQDALRRDFTINALFLRLSDMKILDFTRQGIKDIENKIIRVTDTANAETIFKQDPLRVLRAMRQSLQLNFKIEPQTFSAMEKSASRIKIVSPERIRDEINKILTAKNPSKTFILMLKINLLNNILPGLQKLKQTGKYSVDNAFAHTMKVIDSTRNDIILRMAVLMHGIARYSKCEKSCVKNIKEIKLILGRLKYSKEFIKRTASIIQNSIYTKIYSSNWTDGMVRKFAKKCGNELDLTMDFLRAYYAKNDNRIKINELKKRIEDLKSKNILYNNPILTGKEIIKIFNNPAGKWIQNAKNKVEEIQLENPRLTKEQAIKIVEDMLNKQE
ncbi:MAG: CCA tRNA nucleotidyltransferase [Endomicrobium sp.]|jgi:tRNA nucleotidyltransferase/poly(A) polymerase|nr:CCA tRNA nucleotidyltransferase [Endomicrobium sp.]